ncbi:MAG: phosphotransferase [Pseudomonadota bacterium]
MRSETEQRKAEVDAFLAREGWTSAEHRPLGQDASTRSYVRLVRGDGARAMLMDAPGVEEPVCPPDANEAQRIALGWNATTRLAASRVDAFVALGDTLRRRGFSAPEIYAADAGVGLALIEDFGEGREFARLIERDAEPETELYAAAGDLLGQLHSQPAPEAVQGHGYEWPILDFDALALRTNADLFAEWYPQFDADVRWSEAASARWAGARDSLIARALAFDRVFTLRDYHAENLLWLADRTGAARVGLLDFQDAVRGWAGWDMAMLTQDARRDVSPAARDAAFSAYLAHGITTPEKLREQLAVIGTLNALRISGLFARLIKRDKKPRYDDFLPRQLDSLARNLREPAIADMADFIGDVAPHIVERAR